MAKRNVAKCDNDHVVDFCHADATNLQFEDCEFDAVVSIGILHHINNYEKALSEIFRVIKPGGIMFLEEVMKEAHFWPIGKLMVPAVLFNDREFFDVVKQQGFNITIKGHFLKAFLLLECIKESDAIPQNMRQFETMALFTDTEAR